MDNNLDDQKVTGNTEEGTISPSYTDPNAGYTGADSSEEKTDYVPKDVEAKEKPQQTEAESTTYTYGEPPKEADNAAYNSSNPYNSQNPYQMPPKQLDPSPLSTGEWILTLIVGIIPCVGLILYLIWAFSNSGNLNRRNYCRASLIIMAVSYVIVFFFVIVAVIGGLSAYRY